MSTNALSHSLGIDLVEDIEKRQRELEEQEAANAREVTIDVSDAPSDSEADRTLAKRFMHELVAKQSDYQERLQTNHSILATNKAGGVKIYKLEESFLKGQYIKEWTLQCDEITKITLDTSPSNLGTAIGKHSLAGGLTYGVTGLVVGAVIDEIRGPKREDVWVWFQFHTAQSYPYACKFEAYRNMRVPMTDENLEPVFRHVSNVSTKIGKMFPGKLET